MSHNALNWEKHRQAKKLADAKLKMTPPARCYCGRCGAEFRFTMQLRKHERLFHAPKPKVLSAEEVRERLLARVK